MKSIIRSNKKKILETYDFIKRNLIWKVERLQYIEFFFTHAGKNKNQAISKQSEKITVLANQILVTSDWITMILGDKFDSSYFSKYYRSDIQGQINGEGDREGLEGLHS